MTEPGSDRSALSRENLSLCAHDLRGALTVIAGYTGILRRGGLSEAEQQAALDGIEAAVTRIDRLVDDTLAGRPVPRPEPAPIDLVGLARRAAADARAAFGREVSITAPAPVFVRGDKVPLERALENLLSNAAKYAPDGGIDVTVSQEAGTAVIEVADRGPGIPDAERSAVFEPFTRLAGNAETPGTGLGLTVVRSVIERAGGSAQIAEREGGGTIVRLLLPSSGR